MRAIRAMRRSSVAVLTILAILVCHDAMHRDYVHYVHMLNVHALARTIFAVRMVRKTETNGPLVIPYRAPTLKVKTS
jgi:hypothetical protein